MWRVNMKAAPRKQIGPLNPPLMLQASCDKVWAWCGMSDRQTHPHSQAVPTGGMGGRGLSTLLSQKLSRSHPKVLQRSRFPACSNHVQASVSKARDFKNKEISSCHLRKPPTRGGSPWPSFAPPPGGLWRSWYLLLENYNWNRKLMILKRCLWLW